MVATGESAQGSRAVGLTAIEGKRRAVRGIAVRGTGMIPRLCTMDAEGTSD